jgi:hypothetical protein
VREQYFIKEKKRYRPFLEKTKVKGKGCSRRLRRAICDFGIDCSFNQAEKKLKEHYGVDVCVETIRKITEQYAKQAQEFNQKQEAIASEVKQLIAESDGSMVPIVEILLGDGDKRKRRGLFWKEFRLAAIQIFGEINWTYAIAHGSAETLGDELAKIAKRSGFGDRTKVHGLGDGAPWVQEQMEKVFGCQMEFMIDFFHLCEYLSAAADIFGERKEEWMKNATHSLKQGKAAAILMELKKQQEQHDEHEGLFKCIRYMENRRSQFFYDKAIAKGLPIGSGKIESSHRNIIQQRMKKPGAWWKPEIAIAMIHLRVLRANRDWNKFWEEEAYRNKAA